MLSVGPSTTATCWWWHWQCISLCNQMYNLSSYWTCCVLLHQIQHCTTWVLSNKHAKYKVDRINEPQTDRQAEISHCIIRWESAHMHLYMQHAGADVRPPCANRTNADSALEGHFAECLSGVFGCWNEVVQCQHKQIVRGKSLLFLFCSVNTTYSRAVPPHDEVLHIITEI